MKKKLASNISKFVILQNDFSTPRKCVLENSKKFFKFQDFLISVLKISRSFGFSPFQIDDEGKIYIPI